MKSKSLLEPKPEKSIEEKVEDSQSQDKPAVLPKKLGKKSAPSGKPSPKMERLNKITSAILTSKKPSKKKPVNDMDEDDG